MWSQDGHTTLTLTQGLIMIGCGDQVRILGLVDPLLGASMVRHSMGGL